MNRFYFLNCFSGIRVCKMDIILTDDEINDCCFKAYQQNIRCIYKKK